MTDNKTPKPSTATADLGVEKVAPTGTTPDHELTKPASTHAPTDEAHPAPIATAAEATEDADIDKSAGDELTDEEKVEEQFPSLIGEPELEVGKRSNDAENDDERDTFKKVFVLPKADYEGGDKSAIHRANEDAVRQFLINQGLRPLGPITHSAKAHPDKFSVNITYLAKAVPAAVTTDFAVAHARVDGQEVGVEDPSLEAQRLPGDVPAGDELADPGKPE